MTEATRTFINQVRAERAELADRLARLEDVLSGLAKLYPDLFVSESRTTDQPQAEQQTASSSKPGGRSTPAKYVLRDFLTKVPGQRLTIETIAADITSSGWGGEYPDPSAVLRTAARRLSDTREFGVQREKRDGRSYVYWIDADGPYNAESPAVAGLSGATEPTVEGGDPSDPSAESDRENASRWNGDHRDRPAVAPV